jgi:hypothetical protein
MSILNKFLKSTATITGLVALSLITIPVAEANDGRGKDKVFKNGSNGSFKNRSNRAQSKQNAKSKQNHSGALQVIVNNNRGSHNGSYGYNRGNHNASYNYDSGRHNRSSYNISGRYNAPSYRNSNNRSHYRYGGNNSSSFFTGLVGGAILYSAFNNNNNYNYNYGYSNYGYPNYSYSNYGYGTNYRSYRPNTNVVYVDRPVVQQVPVYVAQPQAPAYPAQTQQQANDNSCLQTREYTSEINIGGQTVPAYGQACLQPDGSWKFGEAIPVPNF